LAKQREADGGAAAVWAAVTKLSRRLRAEDDPSGVAPTALSLLARLFSEGPTSASELATRERLQPQSLTRALHVMEQSGLITRAVDEGDRRRSTIQITGTGRQVLREAARRREAWLARAMTAMLSASERDALSVAAPLLERLAEAEP
jgi:DNA-binding MarR family transcriptional regulator